MRYCEYDGGLGGRGLHVKPCGGNPHSGYRLYAPSWTEERVHRLPRIVSPALFRDTEPI
jgi:hypothetical protein